MKKPKRIVCGFCKKSFVTEYWRKYCKDCSKKVHIKQRDEWFAKHPNEIKESKRREYLRNIDRYRKQTKTYRDNLKKRFGKSYSRVFGEEYRFGRQRKVILERDDYKCQKCGSKKMIVLHHVDKTGRTINKNHNNNLENLITLCRSCHINIHREDLEKGRSDTN